MGAKGKRLSKNNSLRGVDKKSDMGGSPVEEVRSGPEIADLNLLPCRFKAA